MADYEVLAPGGHENLINNVTERLDEKAYIDGYYAQLTAGAADSLTGRGDGVSASYLYRTTGGDADVADGTATVKSIHGRTLGWNQLAPAPFRNQDTSYGITFTPNSDGSVTLSGTATQVVRMRIGTITTIVGHKYAVYMGGTIPASNDVYVLNDNGGIATNVSSKVVATATAANGMYVRIASGTTVDGTLHPQIFDLTAMFSAGNEPSTVAEFEALFPEPYYPYDAGSLLSVQMEGIETVGFNQWDEQWELGKYNTSTGEKVSDTLLIRCANPIPVLPSTAYYVLIPHTSTMANFGVCLFYDADGGYISNVGVTANGYTLTTPSNAHYMTFFVSTLYGTTYKNNICINFSWSGYRNGEYEPYWKSERTIPAATYFPNGMRSAGTVYDELTSDAAVTRVGAVDLGTLTWSKVGSYYATSDALPNVLTPATGGVVANATCDTYEVMASNAVSGGAAGGIGIRPNGALYASDNGASPTGTLYYALATPTTTPIDPPLNLSYKVSDFGTERVMVPANEQSAPPTMQVVYGLNVVDTVRRLPTEYISHDSFTQFRLALGAKLGIFIIETWDETDGRYEYTINDA